MTTKFSVLDQALSAVRDRGDAYGADPLPLFRTIADLWSTTLGHPVTPFQACLCLGQLKVARLIHAPSHEDSAVDLAGYAALAGEIGGRE